MTIIFLLLMFLLFPVIAMLVLRFYPQPKPWSDFKWAMICEMAAMEESFKLLLNIGLMGTGWSNKDLFKVKGIDKKNYKRWTEHVGKHYDMIVYDDIVPTKRRKHGRQRRSKG